MADNHLQEQSLGDLAKRLSEQTSTLVRQELALARVEMQEKSKTFGLGGGLFGAAGLLGVFALALVLTTVVLALIELGVVAWLAALIVGVVVAAVAGVLALLGRRKVQEATPPAPERAVRTTRRDVDHIKERARR
jgi:uncharacterized membrane protein YqjE